MELIYQRLSLLAIEHINVFETNIRVFAKTKNQTQICPNCFSLRVQSHGIFETRLADLPYEDKKVFLFVKKKRYKCQSCAKTFFETIPYKLPFNKMTVFLAEYISEKYTKMSCSKLSQLLQIDRKTIIRLIDNL